MNYITEARRLGIEVPFPTSGGDRLAYPVRHRGGYDRPDGLCVTDHALCRKFRNQVREALAAEELNEQVAILEQQLYIQNLLARYAPRPATYSKEDMDRAYVAGQKAGWYQAREAMASNFYEFDRELAEGYEAIGA